MSEPLDLEQTIADSVNDAYYSGDDSPIVDTPVEAASDLETPPDSGLPQDTPQEGLEASQEPQETSQVSSPASQQSDAPKDDFERLAGMPQMGVANRENRIPYSRVKKITEKAVGEAEGRIAESILGRKLNQGEKPLDIVKTHVSQLQTTNQDYENRLSAVGQFEQVMTNEPQRFLEMVSKIPAYEGFFSFVRSAWDAYEKGAFGSNAGQPQQANPMNGQQTGTVAPVQQQPVSGDDPMPEPDETLPDGSKQYSMAGVQSLLDWNSRKTAKQVMENMTKQFDERFKPIETDWQTRQRIEQTIPIIRMQIEEARTWPMFKESEPEIVKVLEGDKNISLEAAYRKVVFPKILADRSRIKQDVIREIQTAPSGSPTVAPRIASKPNPVSSGPRSLEDVIKEQVANLRN